MTRRSHTGVIFFVNTAPILWYSKRQNTVKSSAFGCAFVVMRIAIEMMEGQWLWQPYFDFCALPMILPMIIPLILQAILCSILASVLASTLGSILPLILPSILNEYLVPYSNLNT